MKITEKQPTEIVVRLICDICGKQALEPAFATRNGIRNNDWIEFQEFISISTIGGYGSVFGDGAKIEIDICQHCFKEKLGVYWRPDREPKEDS